MPRLAAGLVMAALAFPCLLGTRARAQPLATNDADHPPPRPFGTVDYLATAGVLAGYYAIELGLEEPQRAHWTEPVPLLDRPARALFRLRSAEGRAHADQLSDHLWAFTTTYPVAMSVMAPLVTGRGFHTVWQMTMMNLQAFAIASLIVRLPHKLVGRLRPLYLGCEEDPNYSPQCGTERLYLSFYGGHTAITMTGAGLACAHHLHGQLFGVAWADALGCTTALAMASGVFVTRMQADKHWLSDQLLALTIGLGVGYGLPTLLYYHPFFGDDGKGASAESIVLPNVSDDHVGATWLGTF